jgi:hypothetical protein
MTQDGLIGLPAASRLSIPWRVTLRKEDNSIRVTLHESTPENVLVPTPEDDGVPCFLLYGPRVTIKMRCESVAIAEQYLMMTCSSTLEVTQKLHTCEWAMIASLNGGEIPANH